MMPLTDNGYDRPELDDLRDDINALFVKYFGDGIDLDDEQTPGMIAGILPVLLSRVTSGLLITTSCGAIVVNALILSSIS